MITNNGMELTLARSWRALACRGAVSVLFGFVTFVYPGLNLTALVLLFGSYTLLDGLFALIAAGEPGPVAGLRWWMFAAEGLLGIALGLGLVVSTGITAVRLLYVIAVWAIVTGFVELGAARRLRDEVPGDLLLAIGGGSSVALGLLMLSWPHAGALVLVILFGAYALLFGTATVSLAFKLRAMAMGRWSI